MTVETGLEIMGGADDHLRLTNKKKRAELVTQTMLDKQIIKQIRPSCWASSSSRHRPWREVRSSGR